MASIGKKVSRLAIFLGLALSTEFLLTLSAEASFSGWTPLADDTLSHERQPYSIV